MEAFISTKKEKMKKSKKCQKMRFFNEKNCRFLKKKSRQLARAFGPRRPDDFNQIPFNLLGPSALAGARRFQPNPF